MDVNKSRRDFLKKMSAASLSAAATTIPGFSFLSSCSPEVQKMASTADTVILLWMAGGMAHTETFDPKAYVPFEKGVELANKIKEEITISKACKRVSFKPTE